MANSSNPEGPVRQYDCEETPRVRLERLITERYGYLNNNFSIRSLCSSFKSRNSRC